MKQIWLCDMVRRTSTIAIAGVVLLACATAVNAADGKQDDGWHFTLTPYIWAPTVTGSMHVEPPPGLGSGNIDTGPDSYLSNLKFVLMADFQVRKKKWSLVADTLYVDFADPNRQATIPAVRPGGAGLTVKADTGLKALIFTPAVAYTVLGKEKSNLDLLAGVRYARLESKIGIDISGLPPSWASSKNTGATEGFVDPIIGFQGKLDLGKKWYLPYHFDIGGFGLESDLTMETSAGVGHQFKNWFSMGLSYRYLHYNFGDTKRVNTLDLYGPVLGFSFTF